jgi:hypothetical protein
VPSTRVALDEVNGTRAFVWQCLLVVSLLVVSRCGFGGLSDLALVGIMSVLFGVSGWYTLSDETDKQAVMWILPGVK